MGFGNIKSFEKPFTHAEVVALADRTLKRFGGDRNKAGRYARSMESRYESSKWAQVVEVLATSGRHHATMKKSPDQLDREIAQVLGHSTKKTATKRWNHGAVARSLDVPEDVVRRIYAAVQTAKKQGLYGGYYADLVERMVGRNLVGAEYTVAVRAKEHLNYNPPGGYGGPKPTGSAKEPPRTKYDDPKVQRAGQLASQANKIIMDILHRRQTQYITNADAAKQRDLLRQVADELDVAADLYEEAGAGVRAGTLHERARLARRGDYAALATYE